MPTYQWNNTLSVGHDAIDHQHMRLFSIVEDIHNHSIKPGSTSLKKKIGDLVIYTRVHFEDEERLMESVDYPELEAHKRMHAALIDTVKNAYEEVSAGHTDGQAERLAKLMGDWLVNHIAVEDKKYSAQIAPAA